MISRVLIQHYTENFIYENPFHKLVYILLAVSQLGRITGPVSTFTMLDFISFMHHMHMAHGLRNTWSMYRYK